MNKQLGQVFTKKIVADFMVELFNIRKDAQLLDPCFGEGVFIKSALNHGFKNIDGYEIDKELFRSLINEGYSGTNLYNCDFLKSTSNKKYDGVIMNPPYIRHEEIDDLIIYDISKEKLREDIIFKELPKTANLYMYFVIKAFDMLKENGEMIIIFPSTWLTTEGGEYFKRLLFNNYSVVGQYEVFGEPFHRDALVEVSILHVKKTLSTANNIIDKKILNIYDRCIEEYKTQDIKLNFDISFNSYAKIRRGLTTGFNKLYINPEGVSQEFLKPIVSSPKDITGYSTDNAILDYVLMLNSSTKLDSSIKQYLDNWKKIILETKKPKTLYNKINANSQSWYMLNNINSEGIWFNYFVRDNMKFIFNDKEYIARDNFYIIQSRNMKEKLLFALLNNYYSYYQLEKLGKKYGAGLLKLQKYDLENLKFIDIEILSEKDKNDLIKYSNMLIEFKRESAIDDITKILSKYSNIKYNNIKEAYFDVKMRRLRK